MKKYRHIFVVAPVFFDGTRERIIEQIKKLDQFLLEHEYGDVILLAPYKDMVARLLERKSDITNPDMEEIATMMTEFFREHRIDAVWVTGWRVQSAFEKVFAIAGEKGIPVTSFSHGSTSGLTTMQVSYNTAG